MPDAATSGDAGRGVRLNIFGVRFTAPIPPPPQPPSPRTPAGQPRARRARWSCGPPRFPRLVLFAVVLAISRLADSAAAPPPIPAHGVVPIALEGMAAGVPDGPVLLEGFGAAIADVNLTACFAAV